MKISYLSTLALVLSTTISLVPLNINLCQNFYGAEFTVNYNAPTTDYDVVLGLYQDANLDTSLLQEIIHPGFGDPEATISTSIDTVIEITPEISLYQYRTTVNYGSDPSGTSPFWGEPTPLPLGLEIDNITDDCSLFLQARLQLSDFGTPESNPTIAHWTPYAFDQFIDESGVFHMQVQGTDDVFGKVSYHGALSLYGMGSTCLEEGAFDAVQFNNVTGEIRWLNPQPGTFLFGIDLVEWYGDYLLPLSRFPRYLVITIDEDDIVSNTREENLEELKLKVYPNPVLDRLRINIQGLHKNGELTIINPTGREHYRIGLENTLDDILEIDVSGWQSGLYVMQVRTDQQLFVEKIIVK